MTAGGVRRKGRTNIGTDKTKRKSARRPTDRPPVHPVPSDGYPEALPLRYSEKPRKEPVMANFHDLIQGFHNFKEQYFLQEAEFFEKLAHGQNPKTLVIACCDSRADPGILMGCKPGDLFVVRNVAALVPAPHEAGAIDAVMAAVEYAVKHLDIHHIIVMGHSNCGGIQGLLHKEKVAQERYVTNWVALAQSVLDELEAENPHEAPMLRCRRCEEGAVLLSIENLLSYDWVHERVEEGTLSLHALYYDMAAGNLCVWNAEKEDFEPTTTPLA